MRTVDIILCIYSLSLYGHLIEGSSLLLVPLTSVDGNGGAAVKLLYFLPLLLRFSSSSFYLTAFLSFFFSFCFSPSSYTSYDIFVRQIITDTDVRTFTERQSEGRHASCSSFGEVFSTCTLPLRFRQRFIHFEVFTSECQVWRRNVRWTEPSGQWRFTWKEWLRLTNRTLHSNLFVSLTLIRQPDTIGGKRKSL